MLSLARARRALKRLDPSRDPEAERISRTFLVVFALAAACSVFIVFRYYEPGRDVGFHAYCVRILHDRSVPGSVFHDRIEPMNGLYTNTLLYSVATLLAKIVDPYTAFRLVRLEYFLGLPLVTLYALRRLGRSPWGALLAFPMEYMQAYAAGFVNFSFAGPLLIAALLAHWLFMEQPTLRRGAAAATLFALVFLAHAHVYLWLGALLIPMSLYGGARELTRHPDLHPGARLWRSARGLLLAFACALPSLVLFGRWWARFYGPHRVHSEAELAAAGANAVGMHWLSLEQKMLEAHWGPKVTKHTHEGWWAIGAAVLVLLALVLAQREKRRSTPIFELCGIVTLFGYFYLPDDISGQQIARRSWDMGAWMVPFFVTPVLWKTSRWARGAVICGVVFLTFGRLRDIQAAVRRFNVDELAGFDAMVAAAPHEDLSVAWSVRDIDSPNVVWLPFYEWHQMFGARTGLEAPLYATDRESNAPVRYRLGPPAPPTLIIDNANWGLTPGSGTTSTWCW